MGPQSRKWYRQHGWAIPVRKAGAKQGYKQTLGHRIKNSISRRRYLFDIHAIASDQKHRIMQSIIYKVWRQSVFERDSFTCQDCGQVRGYIEAHHKKSWAHFPNLRFEVSNGITLCKKCHQKITSKRMRGNKHGRKKSSGTSIGAVQTDATLF